MYSYREYLIYCIISRPFIQYQNHHSNSGKIVWSISISHNTFVSELNFFDDSYAIAVVYSINKIGRAAYCGRYQWFAINHQRRAVRASFSLEKLYTAIHHGNNMHGQVAGVQDMRSIQNWKNSACSAITFQSYLLGSSLTINVIYWFTQYIIIYLVFS